jgi:hypothetical protein
MIRLAVAICTFSALAFSQGPELFGFFPNSGQFPPAITFVRYGGLNDFLYLTRDSFVLSNGVRIQIAGISASAQPAGGVTSSTIYNFYEGNNAMTNVHAFSTVTLGNVYPGINASWSDTHPTTVPSPLGFGYLTFSIAPGADPSPLQINVLNIGGTAMQVGSNSIWFLDGRFPGVFAVGAQATQTSGGVSAAVSCSLTLNASGGISIQLAGLNPALESDVTIMFPDDGLYTSGASTNGFLTSTSQYSTNFGQDGSISNPDCSNGTCAEGVVAKVDSNGNPIWVTVLAGTNPNFSETLTPVGGGVVVGGRSNATDFPVTSNAPHPTPGSSGDVFLAYLDGSSGKLLNATYAGFAGPGSVFQQIANANGQIAAGGNYTSSSGPAGYILLWNPVRNQFVYTFLTSATVEMLVFDANSDLYFATLQIPSQTQSNSTSNGIVAAGELDPGGRLLGSMASFSSPSGTTPVNIHLQPTDANGLWIVYGLYSTGAEGGSPVWAARILPSTG